ncbi:MAG: hypothetical protein E6K20_15830 [Gammaproteobacteria bacterium]|nr:MAG: hypothetical protein E6K20_15830 [Gammaproteobacteria bacterium]
MREAFATRAVERHGVADEGIFEEDARARRVVVGIEAQFHFLPHQFGPHFPIASPEADGAILAHDAPLAVQEHIAEVLLAWEGAQEGELSQPVFTRHAVCGAVFSRVIFRGKPRPMLGIEFGERKRLVGQFVADLFAPSAMPSFNNALGLTILDLRVQ